MNEMIRGQTPSQEGKPAKGAAVLEGSQQVEFRASSYWVAVRSLPISQMEAMSVSG